MGTFAPCGRQGTRSCTPTSRDEYRHAVCGRSSHVARHRNPAMRCSRNTMFRHRTLHLSWNDRSRDDASRRTAAACTGVRTPYRHRTYVGLYRKPQPAATTSRPYSRQHRGTTHMFCRQVLFEDTARRRKNGGASIEKHCKVWRRMCRKVQPLESNVPLITPI